jgi:stage II sporulation protein D
MPALFEEEALKAQSVASRSFALSKLKKGENTLKISSTINDQIYLTEEDMKDKWQEDYSIYYEKIKNIVLSTKNIVMKKDDKILKSYYFAMSNGYTEDSKAVFGDSSIRSVESKWDNESLKNFKVSTEFTGEEILKALNLNDNNLIFSDLKRNNTNHVENLKVNNIIFTGIEFRKLLKLRSTDFSIEENQDKYVITTRGYGHGVGMSQYGANQMAKIGYTYEEILKHYYNDIIITKI